MHAKIFGFPPVIISTDNMSRLTLCRWTQGLVHVIVSWISPAQFGMKSAKKNYFTRSGMDQKFLIWGLSVPLAWSHISNSRSPERAFLASEPPPTFPITILLQENSVEKISENLKNWHLHSAPEWIIIDISGYRCNCSPEYAHTIFLPNLNSKHLICVKGKTWQI